MLKRVLVPLLLVIFSFPVQSKVFIPSEQEVLFQTVGAQYNIDPALLTAIAITESGFNLAGAGEITPYPWVLRLPTQALYFRSYDDAKVVLKRLIKQKASSIDIGLMQINSKWHKARVNSTVDLLQPETNVKVGAEILNELLLRHPNDLWLAVGSYHSLDRQKARRYARRVRAVYLQLKES